MGDVTGCPPSARCTLLMSDIHLRAQERGLESMREFVALLRRIDSARVDRVVVLGDLFDFWFEYRHAVFAGYFDVLRAFADLRDQGIELHFVCGNHDLWAGRFLEEQVGFNIHRDRWMTAFGGRRALMVHGDGLNPRDVAYRGYKWLATRRWVVAGFRLLHPDWAMALARLVSRHSRGGYQGQDPAKGAEVTALREFARRTIASGAAEIVVCGHSHCPVIEEIPAGSGPADSGPAGSGPAGLYINTGDWMYHQCYVEWDGETFVARRAPEA